MIIYFIHSWIVSTKYLYFTIDEWKYQRCQLLANFGELRNTFAMKKKMVNAFLHLFNYEAVEKSFLARFTSVTNLRANEDLKFLRALPFGVVNQVLNYLDQSNSQFRQDLFALATHDFKRDGFFVEIGAANGVHLSNTLLLEKSFSWKGILVEPAKIWQADLSNNRTDSIVDNRCVWSESKCSLLFNETVHKELSTIDVFSSSDSHSVIRNRGKKYYVNTITLLELLSSYNSPNQIDYLSIDTEGSEYEILKNFDFGEYEFGAITVEHNFTSNRELIHDLLTLNGYTRVLESVSSVDDWYVNNKIAFI